MPHTITVNDKRFRCVVADPPWRYNRIYDREKRMFVENTDKQGLSLDEIKQINVKDVTADDSVLFMWTTLPFLKEALDVMETWNYTYKTSLVLVKPSGTGIWFNTNNELCLLGIRGEIKAFRMPERSTIRANVNRPREFYQLIERIIMSHHLYPVLTMFTPYKFKVETIYWSIDKNGNTYQYVNTLKRRPVIAQNAKAEVINL